MNSQTETQLKALIVINPVAGFINVKLVKKVISDHFRRAGWSITIYLTEKDTELGSLARYYIKKGVDLIVVVGGDGTVASVVSGMVNSDVPLGIIPAGTWNAIARYLLLPTNPWRALSLMTGKHQVRYLDLMVIGDKIHALNLSVGMSVRMIKSSSRDLKRKYGNFAYLYNWFKEVLGLQQIRYVITADGKKYHGKAVEIMVANYSVVGLNLLEAPFEIHPDDGKVDVLIFKPRTLWDLPVMLWQALIRKEKRGPNFMQLQACSTITIETKSPKEVQADGELIGTTPVSVAVLPRSVAVIVA